MKAIVRSQYGSPDVLSIIDSNIPEPAENEVLIRVHASTVNRTDCGILLGKPFIIRFFTGLTRPRSAVPGTDFAGVVERTGKNVSRFKAGDKVWGFDDSGNLKSHARYMVYDENKNIVPMPEGITFQQAAASAEGAHYAFNFINKVRLQKGQKVLVNGATGAIGSAMVQLLKYYGVYVTAVCATPHLNQVRSLGADRVIDYLKDDFTKDNEMYEYVFDAVGKSTFSKCKSLLKPKGVYISTELGPGAQNPFLAIITPLLGGKIVKFPLPVNIRKSLEFIRSLIEQEKFRPLIDRTYPMEEVKEAYNYVLSEKKIGNVILSFD